MELGAGADTPDRTILVHEETAEDIEAYTETVHAVPPPDPPVADVTCAVVTVVAFVADVPAAVVVFSVVACEIKSEFLGVIYTQRIGTYGGCGRLRSCETSAHTGNLGRLIGT